MLGREHPAVARGLTGLANTHYELGHLKEAQELHERALAISERVLGSEHPDVAKILHYLSRVYAGGDDHEKARRLSARALVIQERAFGPSHPCLALVLAGYGELHLVARENQDALSAFERAVSIYDAYDGDQEGEPRARFELAKVLVATGGSRPRALSEAQKAAAGYRRAGGGRAKEFAEVIAWLAKNGVQSL